MEEPVLLSKLENRVLLLTLNRPDSRNALSMDLRLALRQALLDADDNPDISVVAITGAGNLVLLRRRPQGGEYRQATSRPAPSAGAQRL